VSGLPLVSVLLTAYNREAHIGASIESVLAQTFTDFELLITDNCSTDATVDVAREYARRDPRIRVVVNETNLGQFGNRNRAAHLARGEFLKYHDSDDIMYPHCLDVMVAPLSSEPRAGFALSTSRDWPGGPCPMLLTPRMSYQREFLGGGLFQCGPASALFRADVFRTLGGFPDKGVGSDHLFWLHACSRVSVLLVPGDLFWYRVHAGQEFQSPRALWEYALVPREVWSALASPHCPLEPSELEQARRNQTYLLVKHAWRDVRAGRWGLAGHRLAQSGLTGRDWLRYLRRPRRDLRAGTPRDARGEYLMPDWSVERQPAIGSPEREP
jgi:Glycosyl transferase family 2